VTELGDSQEISATDSSSSLSSSTLSTLNTAFEKLIGDLGGNTSTGTASTSTAALQSFLSSFLQGLQSSGTSTPGIIGSSVNTTA